VKSVKVKIRIYEEVYIDIPLELKEGNILFVSKESIDSICDLYLEISIVPPSILYFEK